MKKILPFLVLLVGVAFLAGVFFVVRSRGKSDEVIEEEEMVAEIPFDKRPFVSITPSSDGHFLTLYVDNIVVDNAESLDYEILYQVADGRTAGVPGTADLSREKDVVREILLGSESSGKFRYDEGVEEGTLTLRFRNSQGKLVGKLTGDFNLQMGETGLTTVDGAFSYNLESEDGEYFVTMMTFGLPDDFSGSVSSGPYGIFSSGGEEYAGEVGLPGDVYRWSFDSPEWEEVDVGESELLGVFVSSS